MGVALLDNNKKNVSNRKSFIHTIIKVCAKFQELNVLVTIKKLLFKIVVLCMTIYGNGRGLGL